MSLLLCHECYSWVEPTGGRCPDCRNMVDSSAPDPSLSWLEKVIGRVVESIGEVKVERKMLPDRGLLYLTENGLCFLPHRVEQEVRMVETRDPESSILWSLAALTWAPLALVVPFLKKKKQMTEQQVRVFRPQSISPAESQLLPKMLMQNPGVFFVPTSDVRRLSKRRNNWRIERFQRPTMKIRPLGNKKEFHEYMLRLSSSGRWMTG